MVTGSGAFARRSPAAWDVPHRTMNAVPDSILSCRTLDDVLRVSAVLNADKHFREHNRDIDHNNLRTMDGLDRECVKLEGRR